MYTFKHNKTEKDGKRRKVKAIIIFIIFEVVFTLISAPALVFYGPFENIKKLIVGTSWATLNHQYIAKSFLSDQAIERIIGNDFAVDILGEVILTDTALYRLQQRFHQGAAAERSLTCPARLSA